MKGAGQGWLGGTKAPRVWIGKGAELRKTVGVQECLEMDGEVAWQSRRSRSRDGTARSAGPREQR